MKERPPKQAQLLLLFFLKEDLAEEVLGDLDEVFYQNLERQSLWRSKLNYWYQVVNYLRPFALKKITGTDFGTTTNTAMLLNYLNAAVRFFRKNWALTSINVLVFGIGMAACLLIWNKVSHEFSYDKFYHNHENIYRVTLDHYYPRDVYQNSTAQSFYPIGSELVNQYPEIVNYTRVSSKRRNTTIRVGDRSFQEDDFHLVNPSFFEVFSVNMLHGDTLGIGARDVFLAESLARKLYGKADVIGASIDLWNGNLFKVKGVYEDVPAQSHFHYNMLLTVLPNDNQMADWEHYAVHTYIVLRDGVSESALEEKLAPFNAQFSELSDEQTNVDYRWEIALQPLTSIYLTSDLLFEHEINGDLRNVQMLLVMGVLIVFISCFNYINLTNSMYAKRLVEFFVRKVHGANAMTLLKQYAFESLLLLFTGFAFALGSLGLLPYVSHYSLSFMNQSEMFYGGLMGMLSITFMLSVALPAFAFAFINPLKFTRGEFVMNPFNRKLNKSLIVVQFMVSFLLLAGSLTVNKQLDFITHKNPGITISNVLALDLPNYYYPNKSEDLQRFKNEIEGRSGVGSVSFAGSVPGTKHIADGSIRFVGDVIENAAFNYYQSVSTDYFDTYDVPILAGRVFDERQPADSASILINETLARTLGVREYENVIGKKVVMPWGSERPTFKIIGVTKDYYHESLKSSIAPVAFLPVTTYGATRKASIRIDETNRTETIAAIEAAFKKIFPNTFELRFIEDNYISYFSSYYELANLIRALAMMAILMAGVGLFGLASNEAAKRTKEVAIRKVNGAQGKDISILFLKYFGKLVGLAFLISLPVSFYFAHDWLSNFAVRVDLGFWFFGLQILVITVVSFLSIGYYLMKMSLQNPIAALKNRD